MMCQSSSMPLFRLIFCIARCSAHITMSIKIRGAQGPSFGGHTLVGLRVWILPCLARPCMGHGPCLRSLFAEGILSLHGKVPLLAVAPEDHTDHRGVQWSTLLPVVHWPLPHWRVPLPGCSTPGWGSAYTLYGLVLALVLALTHVRGACML